MCHESSHPVGVVVVAVDQLVQHDVPLRVVRQVGVPDELLEVPPVVVDVAADPQLAGGRQVDDLPGPVRLPLVLLGGAPQRLDDGLRVVAVGVLAHGRVRTMIPAVPGRTECVLPGDAHLRRPRGCLPGGWTFGPMAKRPLVRFALSTRREEHLPSDERTRRRIGFSAVHNTDVKVRIPAEGAYGL
jgi:hypothetical protein